MARRRNTRFPLQLGRYQWVEFLVVSGEPTAAEDEERRGKTGGGGNEKERMWL